MKRLTSLGILILSIIFLSSCGKNPGDIMGDNTVVLDAVIDPLSQPNGVDSKRIFNLDFNSLYEVGSVNIDIVSEVQTDDGYGYITTDYETYSFGTYLYAGSNYMESFELGYITEVYVNKVLIVHYQDYGNGQGKMAAGTKKETVGPRHKMTINNLTVTKGKKKIE